MKLKREDTVAYTIHSIVTGIGSSNLTFDKKRSAILENIKDYYVNDDIPTQALIERKNSIYCTKSIKFVFLIPFFVGAVSPVITKRIFESIILDSVPSGFFHFFLNSMIVLLFFGLFYLVSKFVQSCSMFTKDYERYDILEYEIEIIDMVLEARNILNTTNN